MAQQLIHLSPGEPGSGRVESVPWYHVIAGESPVLFLPEGSRLFSIEQEFAEQLRGSSAEARSAIDSLRGNWNAKLSIGPEPLSLSLNIAQSCNMSCAYCYADEGRFGGRAKSMAVQTALRAIDRLLSSPGNQQVSVGFIGGEPLLNRPVLHAATEYAATEAERVKRRISFGITTNGTLVEPQDIELFRRHPFGITVSLDGLADVNDRSRRMKDGSGSYKRAVSRVASLLEDTGKSRVAARVTLTRENLNVGEHIHELARAGFAEIGVSPLRTSPTADLALRPEDWPVLLAEMMKAGDQEWERVRDGGPFRFSNLAIAIRQLHRGEHRMLPCGAADNYVSINADGDYYACHRTIDDPRFALGDAECGPAVSARADFVAARRVDTQEPCRTCWARYLCGGGCHAEVARIGRDSCDYIRGWLEYCIRFFSRVAAARPELLEAYSSASVLERNAG